jgi:hypothetical protein
MKNQWITDTRHGHGHVIFYVILIPNEAFGFVEEVIALWILLGPEFPSLLFPSCFDIIPVFDSDGRPKTLDNRLKVGNVKRKFGV